MINRKIWSKDFILFFTSNFLISITFYLLMTSMTIYAAREFQASQSEAGLAVSLFVIGGLFARFFTGKFINLFGRKKMLYIGLLLFLIASILYLIEINLIFLMLNRFIHGFGFGVVTTTMATSVMKSLPEDSRGEGTGYFSLSTAAGTAIGPFFAVYLTQNFSYDVMFIYCLIFSLGAALCAAFARGKEPDLTMEQINSIKTGFKFRDFFEKGALHLSLLMIIIGIAYSSIISYINSFAVEVNLTESASIFFLVYAISLFISRPTVGKLFDRKGANFVIYPCIIIFSISLFSVAMAQNDITLLLAGIFLAFGYGAILPSMQAIAVQISPSNHIGLAMSTFYICMDVGMGIGPYINGLIIQLFGFRSMYGLLACLVLCLIPIYYSIHGRKAETAKFTAY